MLCLPISFITTEHPFCKGQQLDCCSLPHYRPNHKENTFLGFNTNLQDSKGHPFENRVSLSTSVSQMQLKSGASDSSKLARMHELFPRWLISATDSERERQFAWNMTHYWWVNYMYRVASLATETARCDGWYKDHTRTNITHTHACITG